MTWERAEDEARPVLKCPLCDGLEIDRQQGRMDSSEWTDDRTVTPRFATDVRGAMDRAGASLAHVTQPSGG